MRNVIILFGGTSSERLVSVASAQHLATILPEAELWFWRSEGDVLSVERTELLAHEGAYTHEFNPMKPTFIAATIDDALADVGSRGLYLALHGGKSENGWLQERLEKRSIHFTGSSSLSSALAMNKSRAKDVVRARGVLMAKQYLFTPFNIESEQELLAFQSSIGEIVLKPATEGSSTGLAFIKTAQDCSEWFSKTRDSKDLWLAEERLFGRELTVGVIMHKGCLTVLPPSEVILEHNATFDYQGKYLGKGNREVTPAELTVKQAAEAQSVAILAHTALGCFGYTRTDMIMTPHGYYYLETNTLPGMTRASFIPQQLRAANIDLRQFVEGQIELASRRYDRP